jgi:hypothetical protein
MLMAKSGKNDSEVIFAAFTGSCPMQSSYSQTLAFLPLPLWNVS